MRRPPDGDPLRDLDAEPANPGGDRAARVARARDISVVGYDDSPWDSLLDPPLTTVATPAYELGVAASRRLIAAIIDVGEDCRLRFG